MKKFIIALLLFVSFPAWAEFVVPETPYPVNDYAGVLSQADKEKIAKKIVDLKTATGAQMGVLIVDTLDGTAIEDASIKVVEKWKLGSTSNDAGILLMLAIKDHKSRLEIGRGLEGILTDYDSKNILYNMRPALKNGDYVGAVYGGVSAVMTTVVKNKTEIMTKPKAAQTTPSVLMFLLGTLGVGSLLYFMFRPAKKQENTLDFQDHFKTMSRLHQQLVLQNMTKPIPNTGALGKPKKTISTTKKTNNTDDTTNNIILGVALAETFSNNDSSYDSGSSTSSDSFSSTDWSGGGGGFSGGGSSDGW